MRLFDRANQRILSGFWIDPIGVGDRQRFKLRLDCRFGYRMARAGYELGNWFGRGRHDRGGEH